MSDDFAANDFPPEFFIKVQHLPTGWMIEAGWDITRPAPLVQHVVEDSRIGRGLAAIRKSLGEPPQQVFPVDREKLARALAAIEAPIAASTDSRRAAE